MSRLVEFEKTLTELIDAGEVEVIEPGNGPIRYRLTAKGEQHAVRALLAGHSCEWFARCGRPAAVLIPHPVLGDVPACSGCALRYEQAGRR